jgi:hypothetical protein
MDEDNYRWIYRWMDNYICPYGAKRVCCGGGWFSLPIFNGGRYIYGMECNCDRFDSFFEDCTGWYDLHDRSHGYSSFVERRKTRPLFEQ